MAADTDRTAGAWLDQSSAASARIRGTATLTAQRSWSAYTGWYDAAAVAAQARDVSAVSGAAQDTVTSLFAEYVAHVTAAIAGAPRIPVPKVTSQPVREGADPVTVHARPAAVYRDTFALTGDPQIATQRAVERSIRLVEDDLMLAARQAQQDAMRDVSGRAGVTVARYRRVLRPELSQDGPCGLCVVAANRVYRVKDLMPIHGRCKCETMPIVGVVGGDGDPGLSLNRADLKAIYAAAGSTGAADLKNTRVQVSQHGELGPVLRVRGQSFTGPDDLGAPIDPNLAKQRLAKLQSVLVQLKAADTAGQDVAPQLAYQRAAIDRLSA